MPNKLVNIPHKIVLNNGEQFTTKAHVVMEPDNIIYHDHRLYFETTDTHKPTVGSVKHYHTWAMKNGEQLTAWIIPLHTVDTINQD